MINNQKNPINFENIITGADDLSFLIGAGCSVDPPSCLPTGRTMIEAIVRHVCAESEVETILQLKDLRFEAIIEIVRELLDENLHIIDYYGQCNLPNLQHFFLAEMIKRGNYVMTTNFDFLIEHALIQSNIPQSDIVPVITESDFKKFNRPDKLFQKGKKTLYKIHGSPKNIITNQDTKKSLVATISAFGANKKELNVFQVEPFKQQLLENISKRRTLIVMGYSGSDDFDIVPTLKVLRNLKQIFWINFATEFGSNPRVREIQRNQNTHNQDKIDVILSAIKQKNSKINVYRVDVHTPEFIKKIFSTEFNISTDYFSITPKDWLNQFIKIPGEFWRYRIPSFIYSDFEKHFEALMCAEEMLRIAEKNGNIVEKDIALSRIGGIYFDRKKYSKAWEYYKICIQIEEEHFGDLQIDEQCRGMGILYNNIGLIKKEQGFDKEARKWYDKALKLAKKVNDLSLMATCYNNIAMFNSETGSILGHTVHYFQKAVKLADQTGDLASKALYLNNLAMTYYEEFGGFRKGWVLDRLEMAIKIFDNLGDIEGKINSLLNKARIYEDKKKYTNALDLCKTALNDSEELEGFSKKFDCLIFIASLYKEMQDPNEALRWAEQAIPLYTKFKSSTWDYSDISTIAEIYEQVFNYPMALKWYRESYDLIQNQELSQSEMADVLRKAIKRVEAKIPPSQTRSISNTPTGGFCPSCGAQNIPKGRFCLNCGAKFP